MKSGKHWPIPRDQLSDGSILALKNANRLIADARTAFESRRYAIALSLSVLGLEEFGKCLLLWRARSTDKAITAEIWHKTFKSHEAKLNAIAQTIKSIPPSPEIKDELDKELPQFIELLQKWKNLKMEGIYLDWDEAAGKWYNFNDKPDEEKSKDAEEVLVLSERLLRAFIEETGDLPFTTIKERIQLLHEHKAHWVCENCGTVMMNESEFVSHRTLYPEHHLKFFKNPDKHVL